MSAKWTGKVWDLKIDASSRLVLLAMADHADHNGEHIHAPAPYIAWKTGYSERNVWNIIRTLQAEGLIVLTSSSQGVPNEYKFDFSDATVKDEYTGIKPKRTPDTPEKIAGVRRAKIAGDTPEPLKRLQGLDDTPAKIAGPTPAKIAIDHDQYHIESDHDLPPPTNQPTTRGGGGGFDPEVARLFASYGIKQAEPLARLYASTYPHVTLAELRAHCARLDDPTAGQYRGSRLYRVLKLGPPEELPKAQAQQPNLPPAYYATPPPPRKRKIEEERHA